MMPLLTAALAFVVVVIVVVGVWWARLPARHLTDRLRKSGQDAAGLDTDLFTSPAEELAALRAQGRLRRTLGKLVEQAGYAGRETDALVVLSIFVVLGALVGWLRLGGLWTPLTALAMGAIPIVFLVYKRNQRFQKFQQQFPDALDMMTRAIRAGNALSLAVRLVGEEMPNPTGAEFKKVAEETQLGMDPGEALLRLQGRVATEDVAFFCAAVQIQRSAGGNLAEILDRLSEVVRERFKLLSHARVLSAQHRMTAVCVGLSPLAFALLFEVMRPGYFEPLLNSPLAPLLLGAGFVLEAVGFFVIWRIATIKV
jgi:tight adherence protein B